MNTVGKVAVADYLQNVATEEELMQFERDIAVRRGEIRAQQRAQQLRQAMEGSNEFCVQCFCDMGFSRHLHVDDPRRYKDGARYHEGAGQCCGPCEQATFSSTMG